MLRRAHYGGVTTRGGGCRSVPTERQVRDLVAVFTLRITAQHELHAREQVIFREPDVRVLGVEAQQLEFRIVLAALVPRRDEAIPEAIDDGAVVGERQLALYRGEHLVILRREAQRGTMRRAGGAHQI